MHSFSQITPKNKGVLCKYLNRPLLINRKKFDMRVYVLITCYDPLRIYVFEDGLARFCTEDYSNKTSSLNHKRMHLTNYSVNKKSDEFIKPTADGDIQGSKWGLKSLRKKLTEMGIDAEAVFEDVNDVIVKTILSVEQRTNSLMTEYGMNKNCCFEVLGFDIMIDDRLKPWLLEVNVAPSLSSSSPLDKHIKVKLMSDVFHLIGLVPIDAKARSQQKKAAAKVDKGKNQYHLDSSRKKIRSQGSQRTHSLGSSPSPSPSLTPLSGSSSRGSSRGSTSRPSVRTRRASHNISPLNLDAVSSSSSSSTLSSSRASRAYGRPRSRSTFKKHVRTVARLKTPNFYHVSTINLSYTHPRVNRHTR